MSPDPPALVGLWRLQRDIEDRRAGQRLRMTGTLRIAPEPGGALGWVEAGRLHRPGSEPVEVGRRLRVVRRGAGWWVLFEDSRDFHPWSPGTWVEHPCGPDLYRGLVEGSDTTWRTTWRVTWQVAGPDKDYTMTSTLTRAVAPVGRPG